MIRAYKIATKVKIGPDRKTEGTVTGIWIKGFSQQYIVYEISWWDGYAHKSAWLNDFEIEFNNDYYEIELGFIK